LIGIRQWLFHNSTPFERMIHCVPGVDDYARLRPMVMSYATAATGCDVFIVALDMAFAFLAVSDDRASAPRARAKRTHGGSGGVVGRSGDGFRG
jgi:hypothetical protein